MSAPGERDLTFVLYGLDHMSGHVLADVFAEKISKLVRGLKKIDKFENGGARFEYTVVDLKIGSTEFAVHEKPIGKKRAKVSPSQGLARVASSFAKNDYRNPEKFDVYIDILDGLCAKAGEKFKYGVVKSNPTNVDVRIDPYLGDILDKVRRELAESEAEKGTERLYFRGSAWGAFDGVLKEVDLRNQELRSGHLILSAGNRDIPCVIHVPIEEFREAIDARIIAEGDAIYDGRSAMPSRLEIRKIKRVRGDNFLRWGGSFDEFSRPPWDDEEAN